MDIERARRVRHDIVRVCHSGLDSVSLGLAAERLLRSVVPFDFSCWHNVDPATSMLTSVIGEAPPDHPLLPVLEYGSSDVNQYADLARGKTTVAALRQATNDRPQSSQRFREILCPMAIEDELTASFVINSTFWGCARLYRSREWPPFDSVEVAFVASLAPVLAEGFRTALIAPGVEVSDAPDGPGVLVLDNRGQVESISASAERWLRDVIDAPAIDAGLLPRPIRAVEARARAIAVGSESPASVSRCCVPTRTGGWLVLHGTLQEGGPEGRIAVIVEPAHPPELAPLIVRAYGLTERECEVASYVLQGLPTKQIAVALGVSAYTVNDHLRAVFEKVSVNSRTELAARIFVDHYYPRIGRGDLVAGSGWFRGAE
ncbi:MAG TPA: helix-turn-helix transcriptional regulator [Dehalococcoidia bacterium]|nr:helix-turn-helix transcriptional regulator [Dehalococcoidia bacterium]